MRFILTEYNSYIRCDLSIESNISGNTKHKKIFKLNIKKNISNIPLFFGK